MAESDMTKNIAILIAKAQNEAKYTNSQSYSNILIELRLSTIKLFKNIIKALEEYPSLTVPLTLQLLND